MPIKIFISHSAADEKLASAFVDCLFSCMVLEDNEVRCTSVPGHKLPVGSDTAKILRDELGETSVVVGLITRNAISSSWVLFELGATWGSGKNLLPLLSDEVDFQELPGPLSGHHAVRLSKKNDLVQVMEDVAGFIQAKQRSEPKIDAALDKFIALNAQISPIVSQPTKPRSIKTDFKEPTISGMPFSELWRILHGEKTIVPPNLTGGKGEVEVSLPTLFLRNYSQFCNGVQSNWESNTAGGFLYHKVGLMLLPYDLVKFDKLPAEQAKWFKRIILSANGQKFIAHYKRVDFTKDKDKD